MNEGWRREGTIECCLYALAFCLVPKGGCDHRQFDEYLAAGEWGLALAELAAIVNGDA